MSNTLTVKKLIVNPPGDFKTPQFILLASLLALGACANTNTGTGTGPSATAKL